MSFTDDVDTLVYGDDYIIDRWTFDEVDEKGHIVWHYPGALPEGAGPSDTGNNGDPYENESREFWDRVTMVTVEYDPGSGDYRNLAISPDRPLDPPGAKESSEGPDIPPYDIDDLATGWRIISP